MKTLSAILEALRRPMGQMSGLDGSSGVAYCKVGGTDATKCEMMMFASSLPTLAPAGLFLIKKSATYSGSITEIKELIYSIKYEAWEGKNHAPHKAHTSCNLGFKDAIKTILDGMSSPVQKMHLAHLAEQAEITGVYNGTELVGYGSKLSASALEFKPAGHNGSDNSDTTIKTESASGDNDSEVKEETAGDSSGEISLTPPSDVFSEAKEQETQM